MSPIIYYSVINSLLKINAQILRNTCLFVFQPFTYLIRELSSSVGKKGFGCLIPTEVFLEFHRCYFHRIVRNRMEFQLTGERIDEDNYGGITMIVWLI